MALVVFGAYGSYPLNLATLVFTEEECQYWERKGTHRFHFSYRVPIAPQAMEHLMIEKFLFNRVVEVHVMVQEQVFLE